MPRFIEDLPWTDPASASRQTVAAPNGSRILVLPQQIILWASITEEGLDQLPLQVPRIPILYDTGFNDGFLIRANHFWDWCGPELIQRLSPMPALIARGKPIRTMSADLWLFPNIAGTAEIAQTPKPFRFKLPNGLTIADAGSGLASSLPLLGLLAISYNRCRTSEDGATERFSLDVP